MTGWKRLGIVLLGIWWAFCAAIALYDWQLLTTVAKCCEFRDDEDAVRAVLADGYGNTETLNAAKSWLAATHSLYTDGVLALVVPALGLGAFFVIRWIGIGFRSEAKPPEQGL